MHRRKKDKKGNTLKTQTRLISNLLAGILIGLGLGIGWYFGFGPGKQMLNFQKDQTELPVFISPEINQPAPEFKAESLEGDQVELSSLKGKPVVMNFWATWCIPCRDEMPLLQQFADKFSQELIVLGINSGENRQVIQDFIQTMGITFPVISDPDGDITSLYRVRGFPSTLFIDDQGIIRFLHIGVLSENQLSEYLRKMGLMKQ